MLKGDPAIADAVVIGDRRPYLTALLVPSAGGLARAAAAARLAGGDPAAVAQAPPVQAWYRERLHALQQHHAPFEQIKRITLLAAPFSQEAGELTPTMKVRRQIVAQRYAALIDAMYEAPRLGSA